MAKELHKSLVNYFSHLEKLDEKWKELSKVAERPLEVLRNQTEQYRLVTSREVDDAELCSMAGVRERLVFKILMGIENEMTALSNIITQLNNANQDLKNRLTNLENTRSKIFLNDPTVKELIDGTPYRPRLNLLLEWAIDGFQYYHDLYLRINGCMKQIDYKNEETIDDLTNSFIEDRFKRARIDRILTFTQFLAKESLR